MEELFLSVGPAAFRFLVDSAGHRMDARKIMGIGTVTLYKWMKPAGKVFGPKRIVRSFRPLWFGYPSPLPGFDRICERTFGPEEGYFSRAIAIEGSLETVLARIRKNGLSVDDLGIEKKEVTEICKKLQIPITTRWRWAKPVAYPSQWEALDKLSTVVASKGFVEFVLGFETTAQTRRLPEPALACLAGQVRRQIYKR